MDEEMYHANHPSQEETSSVQACVLVTKWAKKWDKKHSTQTPYHSTHDIHEMLPPQTKDRPSRGRETRLLWEPSSEQTDQFLILFASLFPVIAVDLPCNPIRPCGC